MNTLSKPKEEWKKILTEDIYHIAFEHGTERAGTSALTHNKEKGVYRCAVCGLELFSSETKFDSGTGWPSFFAPLSDEVIGTSKDFKLILPRTEVHCARCGAHLGHVFSDGPQPTGQRYCLNGTVLSFFSGDKKEEEK